MDPTESRILELEVEVEFLRSLLVVLSVYVLPDDALDTAIEDIDIPVSGLEAMSIVNRVSDRLANKLAKGRARKRML